jgi:predicted glycosyltransferase
VTGAQARRLRVLLHAPHLSGVGHHVRMREIARAMATHHDVAFFGGGRAVPGDWPAAVRYLPVPGLHRAPPGLAPLAPGAILAATLGARIDAIRRAVASLEPDIVVIEHYPFSKWELAAEFEALIDAARRAGPQVRVVCSVRDIPRQTRHEACTPAEWAGRVQAALEERFDALLVHGDAALTPLADALPTAAGLRVPVLYTGLVSEPVPPGATAGAPAGGDRYVLASIGGGADAAGLLDLCRDAWERPQPAQRSVRDLVLCQGLGDGEPPAPGGGIRTLPFSGDFLRYLARADLSVSYAGYNTCTNLLATRVRAVVVPNPRMSDQAARAEVLARLGVARVLAADGLTAAGLAEAMVDALEGPRPEHGMTLDGADRTVRLLEQLAA